MREITTMASRPMPIRITLFCMALKQKQALYTAYCTILYYMAQKTKILQYPLNHFGNKWLSLLVNQDNASPLHSHVKKQQQQQKMEGFFLLHLQLSKRRMDANEVFRACALCHSIQWLTSAGMGTLNLLLLGRDVQVKSPLDIIFSI